MTVPTLTVSVSAEFQRLWESFEAPRVHEFLRMHRDLRPRELADIVLIDQWFRWQRGEFIRAEDYLRDYPAIAADRELKLDLVYGEFRLLRELGRNPSLAEFAHRFPELPDALQRQIEIGAWLPHSATGLVAPSHPPGSELPAEFPAIDGYEMQSLLGHGGMGVVYQAIERRLQCTVALKILPTDQSVSSSVIQRFENEARLVARLSHPHIVPIYDVHCDSGCRYFTMKLIGGGSLAEHLPRFAKAPRESAELLIKVGEAVHHAHQHGILHRDLKPSNVLLDEYGQPYVTDFGLARLLNQDSGLTRSHELIGTPAFMAPEQTEAQLGGVTVATDVYGLGAVMYSMLTARPMFPEAPLFIMLSQVREATPKPPRDVNPLVPRDLETICLKAISRAPLQRYASAQEFADDLRRFLDGQPILARPVSW